MCTSAAFALPLIEEMSAWPKQATWGDWLERLEEFAPQVLRRPEFVLRVLADLRPMAAVGPVSLTEVRDVLADRLARWKWSRPRIGTAGCSSAARIKSAAAPSASYSCRAWPSDCFRKSCARIRSCWTISGARSAATLTLQEDRAEHERLLLRLAVGAATERLYVSFPRIETAEARARVPSFYALEVMRAVTGRVPDHQQLELEASEEANASLAWPAPSAPRRRHRRLRARPVGAAPSDAQRGDVKGRAHYMLRLNDCVRRSASERWARARPRWSQYDGLVRVTDATRPFLQSQRLGARPYSVSALQNYAYCPYRFLLSALYHLAPLEEPEPLERMDPLTKGSLFHEVLAEFFRALQQRQMAIATGHRRSACSRFSTPR